jgi:hypothetical protein
VSGADGVRCGSRTNRIEAAHVRYKPLGKADLNGSAWASVRNLSTVAGSRERRWLTWI